MPGNTGQFTIKKVIVYFQAVSLICQGSFDPDTMVLAFGVKMQSHSILIILYIAIDVTFILSTL